MSINLRVAITTDAINLSELAARLFEDAFGAFNQPEDMRDYVASTFTPAKQQTEIEDPVRVIWIAEADNQFVGYAMVKRGSRADGVTGGRTAEIERLYVDRTLHGRGVAQMLMDACVDQARAWNADELWLGVWQTNARAIAFYTKSGFRIVGAQTFLLGADVQHDHVMSRQVPR